MNSTLPLRQPTRWKCLAIFENMSRVTYELSAWNKAEAEREFKVWVEVHYEHLAADAVLTVEPILQT